MLPLHQALKTYRKVIESTLKPVIRITPKSGSTLLWQSKFGGAPYIPLDAMPPEILFEPETGSFFPYPRKKHRGKKNGSKELFMLAQINFEELPPIESFPLSGIMQVFIDDDIFNMEDYHVIYYPTVYKDVSLLWTDFSGLKESECWFGIDKPLHFERSDEPISRDDFRFEKVYSKALIDTIYKDKEVFRSYSDLLYGHGKALERGVEYDMYNRNKLGGYHYSQNGCDGRDFLWEGEESLLLLQFDGCHGPFSWGDGGTACFFIKKKDLESLNFSNVYYHWDST